MNTGLRLRDRDLTFVPGQPVLMGIVNVTPDSFSDGGQFERLPDAVRHGLALADAGAGILDVGGESTRPGSQEVPVQTVIDRVVPVIAELKKHRYDLIVSVDTRKAEVARAALQAGADLVNDVSGLTYEPALAAVTAEYRAALVLMHMRGTPATMQKAEHLVYGDIIAEVRNFLQQATDLALAAGVPANGIVWDPGLGFAKDREQNLELLQRLKELRKAGYPLLVGPSRKTFIGQLLNRPEPADRDWGTAGAVCRLAELQVEIIRVHNVAAMHDALTVFAAGRRRE